MEIMERDLKVQLLQEWEGHPAQKLYQAHLEALCKRKEVEKAVALRANNPFEAMRKQFEIDGLTLAVKSLTNLIASLSQKAENPQGE